MSDLCVGDYIQCHDPEDMIDTMTDLAQEDIETDFVYERDGVRGLWLEVTKIRFPEEDGGKDE